MVCLTLCYRKIRGDLLLPVQVLQLHVQVISSLLFACYKSQILMLVCTQEVIGVFAKRSVETTFFSENAIDNWIFFRNSHCNSQLTELWSAYVFLTIWLFAFVHSLPFLFISLLLNSKLYTENYFTWRLCSHPSLNCKMVSCTVLFCWLTASTSIKWFSLQWPEVHLIFFPLNSSLKKTLKMKVHFIGYWLF